MIAQCDRALAPSGSRQGVDKGSQEGCDGGGPTAGRVEQLRMSLEQQLGPSKLLAAHRCPSSLTGLPFLPATLPIDVITCCPSCCPCLLESLALSCQPFCPLMPYLLPVLVSIHACICMPIQAAQHLSRGQSHRKQTCVWVLLALPSTLQFSPATLDYAMHALSFQAKFDRTGAL